MNNRYESDSPHDGPFAHSIRATRRFCGRAVDAFMSRIKQTEIKKLRDQMVELKSLTLNSLKTGSPLDWFVVANHHFINNGHFHDHYDEWRMRRIRKVLEIFGSDFEGKSVLEIGGGLGDIGAFFASLGARVVSLEGRTVNQTLANIRYRNVPNFRSVLCDIEKDFSHLGRFDLIINFGLIEVVKDIDNVMECCARMSDRIFLETMVCDSTDPDKIVYVDMPSDVADHPLYGKSARPSPFYIERFFVTRGYALRRAFDRDLNTSHHTYDWSHENSAVIQNQQRRFWYFCRDGSQGLVSAEATTSDRVRFSHVPIALSVDKFQV